MAKYVDWYLVELEKKMASDYSQLLIHEAVIEAREHLEAIASEFQDFGMSVDAAERAAVERFGGVEGMVEQKAAPATRHLEFRGNWKPTTLFLILGYGILASSINVHQMQVALVFCAVGGFTLLLAALACLRQGKLPVYRFLLLHVLAVCVIAFLVGTHVIGKGNAIVRKVDAQEASRKIARYASGLKDDEAFLRQALIDYRANDRTKVEADPRLFQPVISPPSEDSLAPVAESPARATPFPPRPAFDRHNREGGYWYPQYMVLPTAWEVSMSRLRPDGAFYFDQWNREPNYAAARKWWLVNGHKKLVDLQEVRSSVNDWMLQISNPAPRFNEEVSSSVASAGLALMVIWFAIAFSLNGLANAMASVKPDAKRRSIA